MARIFPIPTTNGPHFWMGQRRASSTTFFEAGFTESPPQITRWESVDREGPQPAGPSRSPRDWHRLWALLPARVIRSGATGGDLPRGSADPHSIRAVARGILLGDDGQHPLG
jgi:hypothetical protein